MQRRDTQAGRAFRKVEFVIWGFFLYLFALFFFLDASFFDERVRVYTLEGVNNAAISEVDGIFKFRNSILATIFTSYKDLSV